MSEERKQRAKNRRMFVRSIGKGTVVCRKGAHGMGRAIQGKIESVSQGGISFYVPSELAAGEEVEVELRPIGWGKTVRVPAIVRNVVFDEDKGWHVGCEFSKRVKFEMLSAFRK